MDFSSSLVLLLIIAMFSIVESDQSEIDCLRSIKQSFQDPHNKLSSWQFHNTQNNTFICSFEGIDCWNASNNNLILNIKLSDMGLIGEFPRGVANCSSLTGLDLSKNHLYGPIPSDISSMMVYLVTLDLSFNEFSGEIPTGIANCSYLNVLKLDNNLLTGQIPQELVSMARLRTFSVAHNRLSGPVPKLMFLAESYEGNEGLCGEPLEPCKSGERDPFSFVNGLVIGWAVSFAVFLVVGWFIPIDKFKMDFIRRQRIAITRLRSTSLIDNTMSSGLDKFATRFNFFELSELTDNFNENNIIAIGETGTTYKATLTNGRCVAIKRLFNYPHLQHQFESEIITIGRFGHKNLIPLIGFCHEFNDRFIIYKFMPKGNLHDCLFSPTIIEWPVRMKIAVGIAKGIAWLHQNRVVHRGISSKCVLLDGNFEPKISDFGKSTTPDRSYMGWDRTLNGEFSVPGSYEEDVYGFGMVLFELITRKKYVNSFESNDADIYEIVSKLQKTGKYNDEMCRLLRIAGKCLECDPGNWPSMVEVYQMLIGAK